MEVLNIGYGNVVPANRVVAIMLPDSSPMKRLRENAVKVGRLLDATQGRKTRAVVVMDSDHVLLSAVQAHTLASRLAGKELPELAEEELSE
jgi:extracellular matrix regulatory protein A